jgi:hypothetical protein
MCAAALGYALEVTPMVSSVVRALSLAHHALPDAGIPIARGGRALALILVRTEPIPPPRAPAPRLAKSPRQRREPKRITQADVMRQADGAKSLLLEIIRRAAYDWVLYRGSRRMPQRQYAEDAYLWLFVEEREHPRFKERVQQRKELTAFVSICEALDLDPERVRAHVRKLNMGKVLSSGRPPDARRTDRDEGGECAVSVDIRELDSGMVDDSLDFG